MNIDDLNLDLLRSLTVFMESPNMTSAAAKLKISQPLLTKHLQLLEEAAGRPLFYLEGRRKKATRFGEDLYRGVRESLDGLKRRIDALEVHQQDPRSALVRIGGRREILDRIADDLQFSGRLSFEPMAGREVIAALLDRRLEVGISQHDIDSFNFIQKKLLLDQFNLIYPSAWTVKSSGLKSILKELIETRPYVSYGVSDHIRTITDQLELLNHPSPHRSIQNWDKIIVMVKKKVGWAIVPSLYLQANSGVEVIPVPDKVSPATQFNLIYPKEYSEVPWFKELIERLRS